MKKEDLIRAGCMVPDTLQEAMRSGRQEMEEGGEEALETYIYRLLEENGKENTYFDFYFGTLSEEEQGKAETVLSSEQVRFLHEYDLPDGREDVYFLFEENLFAIALRLSVTQMLFSTFYFPVLHKTVWSSYDGKFIVFSQEQLQGKEL